MTTLNKDDLRRFISDQERELSTQARLVRLQSLKLREILSRKNPYLFRAKNVATAIELIRSIMGAFLSSSEEEIFGRFLEQIAVFVAEQVHSGKKSSAEGIDLEFDSEGVRYIVAIKSSTNWGNSSQHKRLKQNFETAIKVQRQGNPRLNVQPVLGICYGRALDTHKGLYRFMRGQSFWEFVSGDRSLYVEMVEPIGHEALVHGNLFARQRSEIEHQFAGEFEKQFCDPGGLINWRRLVEFNSGAR